MRICPQRWRRTLGTLLAALASTGVPLPAGAGAASAEFRVIVRYQPACTSSAASSNSVQVICTSKSDVYVRIQPLAVLRNVAFATSSRPAMEALLPDFCKKAITGLWTGDQAATRIACGYEDSVPRNGPGAGADADHPGQTMGEVRFAWWPGKTLPDEWAHHFPALPERGFLTSLRIHSVNMAQSNFEMLVSF